MARPSAELGYVGEVDPTTGLPEGEGVFRWANGDNYSGYFKNNCRHGYGRTVYADGQSHEGEYMFNVPTGFGKLTQISGDVYLGQFRKGRYSGQGKLTYATGDVYSGSWRRGVKNGAGEWTFKNGDTWAGTFRSNLPHGRGTMIFAESGYTEEGVFFEGKLCNEKGEKKEVEEGGDEDDGEEEGGEEEGGGGEEEESSSDEEAEEGLSVATPVSRIGESTATHHAQPKAERAPKGKTIHLTAKSNADFKEQGYWDERFAEEDDYDWLVTFSQVKGYLLPLLPGGTPDASEALEGQQHGHRARHRRAHGPGSEKTSSLEESNDRLSAQEVHDRLRKTASILVVGCGNSSFSADLYDAGYENITNIDYSPVVIDRMRERHSARSSMTWARMDMTRLKFEPGTVFDIIIDKAAMDALMVDEGDVWDPATSVRLAADDMLRGLRAVLAPAGLFLMISFMQPHFRSKYLMGLRAAGHEEDEARADPYAACVGHCALYDWTLSVQTIDVESGCLSSFLYIMRT